MNMLFFYHSDFSRSRLPFFTFKINDDYAKTLYKRIHTAKLCVTHCSKVKSGRYMEVVCYRWLRGRDIMAWTAKHGTCLLKRFNFKSIDSIS